MTVILWAFTGVVVAFCFYMLYRNHRVFQLQRRMSDIVFSKSDYLARLSVMHSVSYDEMMRKWWIPVKAERFYPDTSFLKD